MNISVHKGSMDEYLALVLDPLPTMCVALS
jgi:hypothetical protein